MVRRIEISTNLVPHATVHEFDTSSKAIYLQSKNRPSSQQLDESEPLLSGEQELVRVMNHYARLSQLQVQYAIGVLQEGSMLSDMQFAPAFCFTLIQESIQKEKPMTQLFEAVESENTEEEKVRAFITYGLFGMTQRIVNSFAFGNSPLSRMKEDMLLECLEVIPHAIDKYRELSVPDSFFHYAEQAVVNRCRDIWRRVSIRTENPFNRHGHLESLEHTLFESERDTVNRYQAESDSLERYAVDPDARTPEEYMVMKQTLDEIMAMPSAMRNGLLANLYGYTYAEMAALTHQTEAALKMGSMRGREELANGSKRKKKKGFGNKLQE